MDQEPITDVEVLQQTEVVVVLDGSNFENTLARLKAAAGRYFEGRLEEAKAAVTVAKAIKITDADSYKIAGELRSVVAARRRDLDKDVKPMKERCDSLKEIILEHHREIGGYHNEVLTYLDPQLNKFEQEQKRLAEIERQKNQKALDKQAEKDRQKQAKELLDQGKDEAAEDLLNRPLVTTAVKARPDIPSVAGQSSRETYSCEIINLMALVKAVAAGKCPISYLQANQTVLNGLARTLKEQFDVPGCKLIKGNVRTSR